MLTFYNKCLQIPDPSYKYLDNQDKTPIRLVHKPTPVHNR